MLSANKPLDVDRIALTNMFKAIAEYGRKVRQSRQAESEKAEHDDPKPSSQNSKEQVCDVDQRNEISKIDST